MNFTESAKQHFEIWYTINKMKIDYFSDIEDYAFLCFLEGVNWCQKEVNKELSKIK